MPNQYKSLSPHVYHRVPTFADTPPNKSLPRVLLWRVAGGKTSTAGAPGRGSWRFAFESSVDLKIKICRGSRGPRRQVTAAFVDNSLQLSSTRTITSARDPNSSSWSTSTATEDYNDQATCKSELSLEQVNQHRNSSESNTSQSQRRIGQHQLRQEVMVMSTRIRILILL